MAAQQISVARSQSVVSQEIFPGVDFRRGSLGSAGAVLADGAELGGVAGVALSAGRGDAVGDALAIGAGCGAGCAAHATTTTAAITAAAVHTNRRTPFSRIGPLQKQRGNSSCENAESRVQTPGARSIEISKT